MQSNLNLNYYYGNEAEQYSFYRIPKILLTDPRYKSVSIEAKVLYGLLLDRMGLSIKNGWMDRERRVYIYFTLEDTMEMMACGHNKAVRLFADLEQAGLIERKRQGQGRPTRIYVKNFLLPPPSDSDQSPEPSCPPEEIQTSAFGKSEASEGTGCLDLPNADSQISNPVEAAHSETERLNCPKAENQTSAFGKSDRPETGDLDCLPKSGTNKTEKKENESSDTDSSIIPIQVRFVQSPAVRYKSGMSLEEMDGYRKLIKENIEYDYLLAENPGEEETLKGYVEQMAEVCCSRRETFRINGEKMPADMVKSRFLKLGRWHIEYVLDSMQKNTTKIQNIRAYTLTALYNSYTTIGQYYTAWVNHDLAEDTAGI